MLARSIRFFFRPGKPKTELWHGRFVEHLAAQHPQVTLVEDEVSDILVVLGGDGTLLDALRAHHGSDTPIVSFNTGNLGFLTTTRDEERFLDVLDKAIQGGLEQAPTRLLQGVLRNKQGEQVILGVNEFFLTREMSWLSLCCDVIQAGTTSHLRDVRASAFLVASPLGSTSFARGIGAPCIDPDLGCLYLKPLHEQGAQKPGFILPDTKTLCMTIERIDTAPGSAEPFAANLMVDGNRVTTLEAGDSLEIRLLPSSVTLLRDPNEPHADRLKQDIFNSDV